MQPLDLCLKISRRLVWVFGRMEGKLMNKHIPRGGMAFELGLQITATKQYALERFVDISVATLESEVCGVRIPDTLSIHPV